MSKKTVLFVDTFCTSCRQKVMKIIASIEGITSIVLAPTKKTFIVIGENDPVRMINKVRKFIKSTKVENLGPAKEEKKEPSKEKNNVACHDSRNSCRRCDVWHHWYVTVEDRYSGCSIL